MNRADVVIVGGGIVGLATAYRILSARPELSLTVLEAKSEVGTGQTSHNSGVVHAGIYYRPGSDNAKWCREGGRLLADYCASKALPFDRVGKLVVALDQAELPRLEALHDRARANGVDITKVTASQIRDREPNVAGLAGLWTPETAVTDFGAVARSLAGDVSATGGAIRLGSRVSRIDENDDDVRVTCADGHAVRARTVIACAGLQSDRVARAGGVSEGNRIVPFRGSWLVLDPVLGDVVKSNIYPVPVPGLPFLGVHLTPRSNGEIWVGPNAMIALAREGARPWSVSVRDARDAVLYPGLWRLGMKNMATAADEFVRDRFLSLALNAVRRYVPSIEKRDLRRGPWGVRAQELRPNGEIVDGFSLSASPRVVHVRNAPSPAATSSLAIGGELANQALSRL